MQTRSDLKRKPSSGKRRRKTPGVLGAKSFSDCLRSWANGILG